MRRIEDIINIIRNNCFIVYGAGAHAQKFLNILKKQGIENNCLNIVISARNHEKYGCIEDIDREKIIVIAAHDKNSKEMQNNLKRLGFKNYITIYPYMTEICYGMPYATNEIVRVNDLVKSCKYGNYLAIYYLAVQCANGENSYGKQLYLKVLGLSSEIKTAHERWNGLISRAAEYKKNGKPESYNIKINPEQKYILDGFHRVALARYFNVDYLYADFFATDINFYNEMTFKSMWTDLDIKNYFTEEEVEKIIFVRKNIFGQAE